MPGSPLGAIAAALHNVSVLRNYDFLLSPLLGQWTASISRLPCKFGWWSNGTPVALSTFFRSERRNPMKPRVVFLSIILGGTVVALPITPISAAEDMKASANASDYSDRDRIKSSTDEKK